MTISNQINNKAVDKKSVKKILVLFSLYLILTPFYFWESGLPQISDLVMIIIIISNLINNKMTLTTSVQGKQSILISFMFILYVVSINFTWSFIMGEYIFIKSSLFYIYNFGVFITTVNLAHIYKDEFFKYIMIGIMGSLLTQLFMLFYGVGDNYGGGRYTLSFNNPNQLGYFAILIFGILVFLNFHIRIKTKWLLFGVVTTGVLSIISLSNAAIISYFGILTGLLIFKNGKRFEKKYLMLLITVALFVFFILYINTSIIHENTLLQSLETRLGSTSDKIARTSEVRGYFRITEYPQFWIFGSGEGAYYRFDGSSLEFHSTWGNLQVSYGIFGLILFITIMIKSIITSRYKCWYPLFFIMLYGVTHNGIRNSLLWILIALMSINYNSTSTKMSNIKSKDE